MDRRGGAGRERPFATLAQLKRALVEVVRDAGDDAQLALIRAHPELAGKAMVAKTLTAESTDEQGGAGLTDCTPEEFARIAAAQRRLQREVRLPVHPRRARAARHGPAQGTRSSRPSSAASTNHPDFELAECLRNIHRIAEIRLDDKFGVEPALGNLVWDWAETLAQHSDPGYAERGELTVTYLTDAHRACAQQLARWMREDCGFDEVRIDAVGNVVGVYHGSDPARQAPAHRQPLRHRAQRRQVRRPARHLRADGLRARAAPRRAGACRSASRWSASPKRKASATRRPSSARAR